MFSNHSDNSQIFLSCWLKNGWFWMLNMWWYNRIELGMKYTCIDVMFEGQMRRVDIWWVEVFGICWNEFYVGYSVLKALLCLILIWTWKSTMRFLTFWQKSINTINENIGSLPDEQYFKIIKCQIGININTYR